MPGETNQWNPELITGNERVEPPRREGYHLSEDIVDQSCKWLRQLTSADPDRPFFLYVAFAAGHSPHHVPAACANKYKGKFDGGWDAARERILARQKASGVLPPDQRLGPAIRGCRSGTNSTPTNGGWPRGWRRSTRGSSITPMRRSAGYSRN